MTAVIAFANQKGGVGKSTLAAQFAYFLQIKAGKKVLFIDMDAQGNSTKTLLEVQAGESLGDKLTASCSDSLFDEESGELNIQTTNRGIDLIGSSQTAEGYDVEKQELKCALLPRQKLASVLGGYDFVIIDGPPSLGNRLAGSLILATHVVCPVKLSGYSVDGLTSLFGTIRDIQKGPNRRLKILGVAINEYQDTAPQRDTLKDVEAALPGLVLKNRIRSRSPIDVATRGIPIFEVRNGQRAAAEMLALFNEMLERAEGSV